MLKTQCSFVVLVALILIGQTAGAAGATNYLHGDTWVQLQGWADDGSADPGNAAVTVVDFGDASYAFGYKWSDGAMGSDMILALNSQTGLVVDYTHWDAFGLAIDQLSYDGYVATSDWINSYLGYWGSDDGVVWTPHSTGVSGRALVDGNWDGWSLETDTVNYILQNPPDTPVPEPGAVALLATGAVALLRRGRLRAQ